MNQIMTKDRTETFDIWSTKLLSTVEIYKEVVFDVKVVYSSPMYRRRRRFITVLSFGEL